MKTKVLIVNSIDDTTTQLRIESIIDSPQIDNYEIFNAYALRSYDEKLTLNELHFRLKLPIKSFNPEYVIFHTGIAFHRNPMIFQKCLIRLKRGFTDIKFTYEPSLSPKVEQYFDNLSEFDKTTETAKIVDLLFFKIFNRTKNDKL
jgi:hypothetical protein